MATPKFTLPRCGFSVDSEARTIRADDEYIGKISGTMLSGVLGCSPWASGFTVACELLGLGTEDISDKPAVRTGHVLESKVIDYLGRRYSDMGLFLPAEAVYGERKGEHSDWTPDFEDDVFTGHVDGLLMTSEGEDYILEIKTSANDKAWTDGVPEYYWWQVALYDRFIARKGVAYLARGRVDQSTYSDPESWVPDDGNVTMYRLEFDQGRVEDGLRRAREFWEALKAGRTTPPADLSRSADSSLYNHLCELGACERSFEDILEEYGNIRRQRMEAEDEIKWMVDRESSLKDVICDHMTLNGMEESDSRSGRYVVRMQKSVRKTVDPKLMEEAGIDPAPYLKKTVYKTLKVKEPKVRDTWQ